MKKEEIQIRDFVKHIRPSLHYFWRAAYTITGDPAMAEYALCAGLEDAYLNSASASIGFRDAVLSCIREAALEQISQNKPELSWPGLPIPSEKKKTAVLSALLNESIDVQRLITLRYGCAMTVKEIGIVLNIPFNTVQEKLLSCKKRIIRSSSQNDRTLMTDIRKLMNVSDNSQFDPEYIIHTLTESIYGRNRGKRRLVMLLKVLFSIIGILLAAVFLWLTAVMMNP